MNLTRHHSIPVTPSGFLKKSRRAALSVKSTLLGYFLRAALPAFVALAAAGQAQAYVFGDPLTYAGGKFVVDFNVRFRGEARHNTFDFNSATETVNDDAFVLARYRIGAKYTVSPKVSFYGQLQDVREYGATRPQVPYVNAAEGNNPLDLRQLYVDLGDPRDDVVYARIGRQMMAYGDERLIGGFEWNNLARTFDAVKVVYNNAAAKTTVDFFAAKVVTVKGRNLGQDFSLIADKSDPHDLFAGIYLQNSGLVKNQKTDVYLLYRGKTQNGPFYRPNTLTTGATGVAPYDIPEKIYTLGVRAQSISMAALGGFDYLFEGAIQWGKSRPGLTNAQVVVPNWYDHQAYAYHLEVGRSWERSKFFPRLSVEYNEASGDKNPNDTENDAFLNLFHTNHKFYGYMDTLGWKNMRNAAVTLRFKPFATFDSSLKKSVLRLDYHWFWLKTNQDLWYRANAITAVATPAVGIRAGLPKDIGQEFDATWSWSPSPPYDILIGYSYFDTGKYLPAARATGTTLGRGDNASFCYAQLMLRF